MPRHPSVGSHLVVDYPHPKILRLRLNRPDALNAMTDALEEDIRKVRRRFPVPRAGSRS